MAIMANMELFELYDYDMIIMIFRYYKKNIWQYDNMSLYKCLSNLKFLNYFHLCFIYFISEIHSSV